jgi:hypothetical protein
MSLFFRHWLDEGFYEEDGYGDLYKVNDPVEINILQKEGRLYYNDGFTTSKVD